MIRRSLPWFVLVLLCLGAVVVRVTLSSRSLLLAGEAAQRAGDARRAVRDLGRAARMDLPANPYSRRALSLLLQIGQEATGKGDTALALHALREARSAVLATRSFHTPHADVLRELDASLGIETDRSAAQAPGVAASLLLLFGAGLFVGAAAAFILRAGGSAGKRGSRAATLGLCGVLGVLLFLLGLWRA